MEKRALASLVWMWLGIAVFWGCENAFVAMYFSNPLINPDTNSAGFFVSILVALSAIANVIGMWISGPASDACRSKFGRRKPYIILGGVLSGSIMMLFPVVKFFPTIIDKLIAAIIIDCSMSFCGDLLTGPRFALLIEITTPGERATVNGILNIPNMVGMAFPVVIAGLSTSIAFMDSFFYIGGTVIIVSTVTSTLFIKEPPVSEQQETFRKYFRKAFTMVNYKKNKPFYKALVGVALLAMGGCVFYPFLLPFITYYVNISGLTFVLSVGSILLISVVVQIPLGKISDKHGRRRIFKIILPLATLLLASVYFVQPGAFFLLVLIGGPAITLYFSLKILVQAWMEDLCPADQKATMFIYNTIADVLMMAPGALIGGLLLLAVNQGPYHPVIFVAGAVIMASSIFIFAKTPETIEPPLYLDINWT
ncbi:MAG: MFS transporter [Candidatus Sigynarchaeota archaeon]